MLPLSACQAGSAQPSQRRVWRQVAAAVTDERDGSAPNGEHEARTYLGFNPYNYLGRESEGNRFITNEAL